MSANNHPERFPADSDLKAKNDRVANLAHKYKVEPQWTRRPTFLLQAYDKAPAMILTGAVIYASYTVARIVGQMMTTSISEIGHPSERHH